MTSSLTTFWTFAASRLSAISVEPGVGLRTSISPVPMARRQAFLAAIVIGAVSVGSEGVDLELRGDLLLEVAIVEVIEDERACMSFSFPALVFSIAPSRKVALPA